MTLRRGDDSYIVGEETALLESLEGRRAWPRPKPPLPPAVGLGGRPTLVQNVETLARVPAAVEDPEGFRASESTLVTLWGDVRRPGVYEVPLGTPLSQLIDYCGGFKTEPARLISGGPMMGQPLPNTKVPAVKGSNGLLALTTDESKRGEEMPCIRCASCVRACPCGLVPLELAAQIRAGGLDNSVKLGLLDCVSCGSCAYACPSSIPLVQYFNFAKGELAARQRSQQKLDETRRLAEARSARMAAIKQAKREAMLKRKQEMEAKKKAEADSDGESAPNEEKGVEA